MKAAILVQQKKPLVIADIAVPKLVRGQVLVKVIASGICGSQLGEIDGVKGPDRFLPHLLGHEGGGTVLETGPGVTRVKKGDAVVLHWRKGLGLESSTPQYRWGDKIVNAGWVTTFNEIAVVSENRLTPVPRDLDPEIGALLGCGVTTGLGVVNHDANIKSGESVLVFGAGGVGLNVIQGAALKKAGPIIAVDIYYQKLKMAKAFGATHILRGTPREIRDKVLKIVGPQGVDAAVENTGQTRIIELAYELTSPAGRTILVGVPKKGQKARIYTLPLHFGKVLTGSCGGRSNPSEDIPKYLRLYRQGRLKLDGMITHRFRINRINDAVALMRQGKTGRCILRWDL